MLHYSEKSTMGCLVLVIMVSSFLALCNGCEESEPERSARGIKPDGCMDGDIKRPLDSTWSKEYCKTCSCSPEGRLSCCMRVFKPVFYTKECEAVLNTTTCKYDSRRNDGSSEPCAILGVM